MDLVKTTEFGQLYNDLHVTNRFVNNCSKGALEILVIILILIIIIINNNVHALCLSTQQDMPRGMNDCRELSGFLSLIRPVYSANINAHHHQHSNTSLFNNMCNQCETNAVIYCCASATCNCDGTSTHFTTVS